MRDTFAPIFLIASIATPDSLILPAMLASNLAQGSASLAVAVKARDKKLKQVAAASSISAFLAGVTEPALYGVTLRLKKPLFIHIGMDTVKLNGKYFEALVEAGDEVQAGQEMIRFDMEGIKAEGYSLMTPVIITNTNEFVDVIPKQPKEVDYNETIILVL